MKIICANNSDKFNFSDAAWDNIRQAVGEPVAGEVAAEPVQEPTPEQQKAAILQEFPFIGQIEQALQQNNEAQAKQIAEKNGISWDEVKQMGMNMKTASTVNGKMVRNAGVFSWFAGLGEKAPKAVAGVALYLTLSGLLPGAAQANPNQDADMANAEMGVNNQQTIEQVQQIDTPNMNSNSIGGAGDAGGEAVE
ncbi:unnamed protein product, partial [marine sediment metagenome]